MKYMKYIYVFDRLPDFLQALSWQNAGGNCCTARETPAQTLL